MKAAGSDMEVELKGAKLLNQKHHDEVINDEVSDMFAKDFFGVEGAEFDPAKSLDTEHYRFADRLDWDMIEARATKEHNAVRAAKLVRALREIDTVLDHFMHTGKEASSADAARVEAALFG